MMQHISADADNPVQLIIVLYSTQSWTVDTECNQQATIVAQLLIALATSTIVSGCYQQTERRLVLVEAAMCSHACGRRRRRSRSLTNTAARHRSSRVQRRPMRDVHASAFNVQTASSCCRLDPLESLNKVDSDRSVVGNSSAEQTGALKMQDMKLQAMKMKDK